MITNKEATLLILSAKSVLKNFDIDEANAVLDEIDDNTKKGQFPKLDRYYNLLSDRIIEEEEKDKDDSDDEPEFTNKSGTGVTREMLKRLRTDVDEALGKIATKYGLSMKMGSATFSATDLRFRVEGAIVRKVNGKTVEPEMAKLLDMLKVLRLKKTDLTKTFQLGGAKFKLVGYSPNRRKNTMNIARVSDDKRFIASENAVRRALGYKLETWES